MARLQRRARQHLAVAVEQGDRITRQHLGGRAVAQQAVDGVFAQHHARKLALRRQWHLHLQQGRHVVARAHGLRIHRLLHVARQQIGIRRVAGADRLTHHAQLVAGERGRCVAGADSHALVDPGDGLQLGVLADQRLGAAIELDAVQVLIGQIARNAHHLFLALKQAQAHTLLCVFHIAFECFLLPIDFLRAQIPERNDDGSEKHQHGDQGGQRRKAVLPVGRQAAPPSTPPTHWGF
ncbi:hypothetical protein SDC9_143132 [bioreactor metagenome]|uniref:Uncharacterized protein n=1 Tax=bioreactor metagenome TaxID=1076179 RepID=A0A645E326_9ZZZZ